MIEGREMRNTTKAELIDALANELNLSSKETYGIVDTILHSLSDAMSRGESIQLRGFGTFHIKQYSSYKGRNPKNGQLVTVKPKKLPVFTVGKELKEAVNAHRGK